MNLLPSKRRARTIFEADGRVAVTREWSDGPRAYVIHTPGNGKIMVSISDRHARLSPVLEARLFDDAWQGIREYHFSRAGGERGIRSVRRTTGWSGGRLM